MVDGRVAIEETDAVMLSPEAYQTLNSLHLSREVRAMEGKKSLRRGSGGPEDHPAGLVSPVAKHKAQSGTNPYLNFMASIP